jgi:hypothetical protein
VRRSDLVELTLFALVLDDAVSAETSSGLFSDLEQEAITNREQNKENVNSFFILIKFRPKYSTISQVFMRSNERVITAMAA